MFDSGELERHEEAMPVEARKKWEKAMEEEVESFMHNHTWDLIKFPVMKPAHKNLEKIDQCLRNKPLRCGNLLYITQMNNS